MKYDIKSLIGETTQYDKKQALEKNKPKSWLKSVSAFANTVGGTLIFGITDDDEIIGLANAESDAESISELIKARITPIPMFDLQFETLDRKKLVVLEVSAGTDTPYFYKADGVTEAYTRVGNESVLATATELRRLAMHGSNVTYDALPSGYKFEDYSFSKLRERYKVATGKSFEDKNFESFGITDANGRMSNAGALLADESPVRHSRVFCTRWNGLTKSGGLVDAYDSAEYSGSLISLLNESVAFIKRNTRYMWRKLPDSRQNLPDYAQRAYSEALVNAIIHRDYMELGSEVHVDIFDDRMTIYSPGGMPDGSRVQELNLRSVPSKRRNPVLADIFSRLDYMERQGSGFGKIIDACRFEANYSDDKAPEFYSDNGQFTVTLYNMNYGFEPDTGAKEPLPDKGSSKASPKRSQSVTKASPEYGESIESASVEHLQSVTDELIDALLSNPQVTQNQLSQLLGVSRRTVQREMTKLSQQGIIRRAGGKPNGRWVVTAGGDV